MQFNAMATREGDWWVVHVQDIGATQGRTRDEAQEMAVDLVAVALDCISDLIEVDVIFVDPTENWEVV